MMQAQIERAGHKATFANMLQDARSTVAREKKRVKPGTIPLVVGRGQSHDVLELLALGPLDTTALCLPLPNFASTCIPPSPWPLPYTVEIQLRYDVIRLAIITHLYDTGSLPRRLPNIMSPFIKAANSIAFEPYYPDAGPEAHQQCASKMCRKDPCASRSKLHLLKCTQAQKMLEAEHQLSTTLHKSQWQCQWGSCVYSKFQSAEDVASHISEHLNLGPHRCEWDSCMHVARNNVELHLHLAKSHATFTRATIPTQFRFCFECAEWITSDLGWSIHCHEHSQDPNIIYGPVSVEGVLVAPRRCPYCMVKGLFTQIDSTPQYLKHVDDHIFEERKHGGVLACPHPTCSRRTLETRELKRHLDTVHAIPFLSFL